VLLINASARDTVKIFQPFYPIHPPVGVGQLVSVARAAGLEVDFIDEQVTEDLEGEIDRRVRRLPAPYFFGISVLTSAVASAMRLAATLKRRYPGCFIVCGGIHPTLVAEEVLADPSVDAVIRGEAEQPLLDLYRAFRDGGPLVKIPNLSYRSGATVVNNPISFIVNDFRRYPPFPYDLFTDPRYDMGFVLSSRGCPYHCIFCSAKAMPGSATYRFRDAKAIVDEVQYLREKRGVDSLIFVDDNFLVNPKRVRELIAELVARGLAHKMRYTFQARGDGADAELFKDLREVGFEYVLFGLETASETVMKRIQKGETVAECVAGVRLAKAAGLKVGATFVFGLPGETQEDRWDAIVMAKELGIDMVRFNNAIPYPGTELYAIAKRENRLNIVGQYRNFIAVSGVTENPFKKVPFAYIPEGTTASQLRRDILLAHFMIYLDLPKTIRSVFFSGKKTRWMNLGSGLLQRARKLPALLFLGAMLSVKFLQLGYYLFLKRETAIRLSTFFSLLRRFARAGKKGNAPRSGGPEVPAC